MSALLHGLKKELIEVLPAVLYFFVAFSLINLTENLMLKDSGIRYASFSRVIVGALIVGKVILVADLFFFVDLFRGRPLIYNTLWKTGFYAIMSLLFRLGELTLDSLLEYKSVLVAQDHILAALAEPRFWAIQLWLVILLLIFVASKELIDAIGAIRIRQLFFGR
jgi:hypothetical protein